MLEVEGLKTDVFGPISFTLEAGSCLVIEGESGSGKTRLLRAIADIDPSRGDVRLEGQSRLSFTAPNWRRKVRLLQAEPGWWQNEVGNHFVNPDKIQSNMEKLGLDNRFLNRQVSELSTGERQRFAFLRAIEDRPEVLLLDEPTSALDPASQEKMETLIRTEIERGACVLLVTHDRQQASRFATHRLKLVSGQGTLQDNRKEPAT